jgi:hypothetical protein
MRSKMLVITLEEHAELAKHVNALEEQSRAAMNIIRVRKIKNHNFEKMYRIVRDSHLLRVNMLQEFYGQYPEATPPYKIT